MAIQMKVSLRRLQTLPSLPTNTHWVGTLRDCQEAPKSAGLGELNRFALHYTSLRDLISVSPAKRGSQKADWCDISEVTFKDKLLKEAARAYLLPTGAETAPETTFFGRCWKSFTSHGVATNIKIYLHSQLQACAGFFRTHAVLKFFRSFGRFFKPDLFGLRRVRPEK